MSRRLKCIEVLPEEVLSLLTEGVEADLTTLPSGTKVIRVEYWHERMYVYVEHPSFDDVSEGECSTVVSMVEGREPAIHMWRVHQERQ